MNTLAPLKGGAVSSVFRSRNALPDMVSATQSGLGPSFASIGYKGKNWRIKYRGDEEILFDERGAPMADLSVVIIGISPNVSKNFYEKKFSEGDAEAPDCFSVDGITPDVSAKNKQCATCAACPQNMWGSRLTDAGKKAKACQDSRRVAVVPAGDIRNANYGGPMLLRIPPMSLANLAKYGIDLSRLGYQPYMVETNLRFDYGVAYPLITFTAVSMLNDEQAAEVLEAMEDPLIDRMLAQEMHLQQQASVPVATAQPEPQPAPMPAPPPPPPAPAPEPAAEPVPVPPPPAAQAAPKARKPAFGKPPTMAPKPAAEPQEAAPLEQTTQPVAPSLATLPTSMEDAIANLLKAPSLPTAH